jgi:hypothetical protein
LIEQTPTPAGREAGTAFGTVRRSSDTRRPDPQVGRAVPAIVAVTLVAALGLAAPAVRAQLGVASDDRLAGLTWRFVRIHYHFTADGTGLEQDFYGEPWMIDGPAAEQNLSRRLRSATSIQVEDPITLTLDDPRLFTSPWIYMVEPGNLKLLDSEARTLREFLLRGGTLTFDDFHGPFEWDHLAAELKKVFPERPIVDLEKGHPVYSCFYKLDGYPQVPGLGSFLAGRTWEKGGIEPHLRTILDDHGRPMLYINWNTDMGDGWEWSNAEEYPDYIKYTGMAYRMGINEVVYALTH